MDLDDIFHRSCDVAHIVRVLEFIVSWKKGVSCQI